jgi:hypothetical protein
VTPSLECGTFIWRGDECFGSSILLDGRRVWLDLRRDAKLAERIEYVKALVGRETELSASFAKMKSESVSRQPVYADLIASLEIDLIAFHDASSVSNGEVYFTLDSGGDSWLCVVEDGQFSELTIE